MISYLNKDSLHDVIPKKSFLDLANDYSIVMNEKGKRHNWRGAGPLSLKLAVTGESSYKVGKKKLTIDENRLLVLNDYENYTINIESSTEVETFIVFFDRMLVDDVVNSFVSTSSSLIDNPDFKSKSDFLFSVNTLESSWEIQSRILLLKNEICRYGVQAAREQLYFLLNELLTLEARQHGKARSLSFTRKSTRDEISKRLLNARDYLHASLSGEVTLDELSKNCALSKNHLLRTFKEYFGKTPFQYLADIRMAKAQLLLANPDVSITEVCSQVGFESLGSFSWTFSRQMGVSPSEYRSKQVIGKK